MVIDQIMDKMEFPALTKATVFICVNNNDNSGQGGGDGDAVREPDCEECFEEILLMNLQN